MSATDRPPEFVHRVRGNLVDDFQECGQGARLRLEMTALHEQGL